MIQTSLEDLSLVQKLYFVTKSGKWQPIVVSSLHCNES